MMNERIRELALQASIPWPDQFDTKDGGNQLTKFAELIVRECVKSTLSLQDTAIDNEWNLDETFHMVVDDMVAQFDMLHIFREKK
jgi:hypothetical protein